MLHVVGVRHHSPACARVVQHTIERVRPRLVLVEGPADMNPRMGELALDHRLPIAVFTHVTEGRSTRVSWTPFCDHSPEWVALRAARAVGAEALFIDLPGWHPAFAAGRDRYAEAPRRAVAIRRLLERAGIDDVDTLWDHLFEGETDVAALAARLEAFFGALRGHDPAEGDDAPREAFMVRAVAWALGACEADGGDVVVVCGGFHAPVLRREGPRAAREPTFPATADADDPSSGARRGSFLVPHEFARMSSLAGHAPGMATPAWDDALFHLGPVGALDAMLRAVVERLRDRKHAVSTASVVACVTTAQGLAHLRGRRAPLRVDLLDAIASTLVDEALDAPLPWTGGGSTAAMARAHPVVADALGAMIGDRRGALARETPRPPLVRDVARALERARIPAGGRISIDLLVATDRATSADLHRLRILGVPGVERVDARRGEPRDGLRETWVVTWRDASDAAVLEASSFGATLESAACARLEEEIAHHVADAGALASTLVRAVHADLPGLASRVGDDVARIVGHEASLAGAGAALAAVHDASTELAERMAGPTAPLVLLLRRAEEVTFDRALWLLEGLTGPTRAAVPGELRAMSVVAGVASRPARGLAVSPSRAVAVARRRIEDADAPASIRGACLGLVWRLGGGPSAPETVRAVRASSQPSVLGDFLAGLFAVAREAVLACRELVATVDGIVAALGADDFLVALPALRWAFSHFPPREREAIAEHVLALHGGAAGDAAGLVRAPVDADGVTRAHHLEREVDRILERYGLTSSPRAPVVP